MKSMKRTLLIILFVLIVTGLKAQVIYQIDSVQMYTRANTPNEEGALHSLYSVVHYFGPVLTIYGRLINDSSKEVVLRAFKEDSTEDISVELYTIFEYKGKRYKQPLQQISMFGNWLPMDAQKGIHEGDTVKYYQLRGRKYIKYRLDTSFLSNIPELDQVITRGKRISKQRYLKKLERIAEEVLPSLEVVVDWAMSPDAILETGGDPYNYHVQPESLDE